MKKIIALLLISGAIQFTANAQEQYGKTLNLGLGVAYYSYLGHNVPVFHANYEFDVAKNFTLAPFISFYKESEDFYIGDHDHPFSTYTWTETVVPIGVKGTYYFDDLLGASSKWDFYLGASLGFNFVSSSWSNGYYGNRDYFRSASPLYLDGHIGAEYHFNEKLGMFLDLSSGISTIGLAIHHASTK